MSCICKKHLRLTQMSSRNLLFSAIHFFVVILLICIGLFLLGLAFLPQQKSLVMQLLQEEILLCLFGVLFLAVGIALFAIFFVFYRGQYLRFSMDRKARIDIDKALFQKRILDYWKNHVLPTVDSLEVEILVGGRLEIIAPLPLLPPEEQEKLLKKIEKDLGEILAREFGYEKEFTVTALF